MEEQGNERIINYQFSTDRAITKSEEDQLNRIHFAKELAIAFSTWTENDSLVVAIYGKWGVGKTSVKNLLVQNIQGHRPILMVLNTEGTSRFAA